MFQFIKNFLSKDKKHNAENMSGFEEYQKLVLGKGIEDNITRLLEIMNNSFDIKVKRIKLGSSNIPAAVMFVDNLTNEDIILEYIIRPLTKGALSNNNELFERMNPEDIKELLVSSSDIELVHSFDKIVLSILTGGAFIMIEGHKKGLTVSVAEFIGRTPEEPKVENSVKGPKEGFVEDLRNNIGVLRKRIRDPNFTLEQYKVGRRTKTNVVVGYVKGIVKQEIVDEVVRRIKSVDVDDAVNAAQLYHLLSDNEYTIFPLVEITERPDKVISGALQGRVAIIVEGTPDVMLVPVTLPMLVQSVDDYYENWIVGTGIRIGRYVALFSSAILPSLYIAFTSFHPAIMPTNIALSIAGTRGGVPFPAFIEAFLMASTLELLQESGIRLPRVVGQTVSIVGGLVIGQAAVQAGIISPVMVIVIAITAICSFAVPDYSLGLATRVLRVPFMIVASALGVVGTSVLLLYLLGYVASLESFGVGYLEPITPYRLRDWKDTLIRGPMKTFGKRPEFLSPEDTQRQIVRKGGGKDEDK